MLKLNGASAQVSLSLGKSSAQVVAQYSMLPGLSPVVDILVTIINICESVQLNRRTARFLRDRCHCLVQALKDGWGKVPNAMADAVQDAKECLLEVLQHLKHWSNLSAMKAFLQQVEIQAQIQKFSYRIDTCIEKFQLDSHFQIHEWQEEFEESSKRDHQELIEKLSDINHRQTILENKLENATEILGNRLDNTTEMMLTAMSQIQNMMRETQIQAKKTHSGLSGGLYGLQKRTNQLLPELHLQAGEVERTGEMPWRQSNTMDVWEGMYLGQLKVYMKYLRMVSDKDAMRRFKREVQIWARAYNFDRGGLEHGKYILPIIGYGSDDGPFPYIVSPWQNNGTILQYVKQNDTNVNHMKLLKHVAQGIELLHCKMTPPLIHGLIKSDNILITNKGDPVLADFGISKLMEDISGVQMTQSPGLVNAYRWMAPEVSMGEAMMSTSSDIYGFAMTILEVLTHDTPFKHIRSSTEVVIRVQMGELPQRPTDPQVIARGLDDDLWALLLRCWSMDKDGRPSIRDILEFFDSKGI